MVVSQYDVWLISLDPTVGHEIKKTRPCLIVSPDEMNQALDTYIALPMTTKSKTYPFRIETTFLGKRGWIALDQIRTVSRLRMVKRLGRVSGVTIKHLKELLKETLVD